VGDALEITIGQTVFVVMVQGMAELLGWLGAQLSVSLSLRQLD